MKSVRQQLQHMSFNLSARQIKCLSHTCTHTQEKEDAQAKAHIMNHLKHPPHTKAKTQQTVPHAKPPGIMVNKKQTHTPKSKCTQAFTTEWESKRQHLALTEHALTNTHTRSHTRGLRLASATELFTDGPRCRETL